MNEPGEMTFDAPVSWFVYVGNGKHCWRFVFFGEFKDGKEAIDAVIREALEMDEFPADSYMAAPIPALYTRDLSAR